MSKIIILFLTVIFPLGVDIAAQTNEANIVSASDDARCELNNRFLDQLIIRASEEKAQIFIISRRSKTERKGVDWARLLYSQTVLSKFKGFAKEKVTIAIGEAQNNKQGSLEFWAGGKLILISFVSKNQQICLVVPDY